MNFHTHRSRTLLGLGLLILACTGCQAPVRTTEVHPDKTYRELDANILNAGVLSANTRFVLTQFHLEDEFERDPIAAIRKLHAIAVREPSRPILFALAEASYAAAEKGHGEECYLAAAVYAYLYLFGTEAAAPPNSYDRRFRVACDLYNRGLLEALLSPDGKRYLFNSGTHPLPVGQLEITATRPGFRWPEEMFDRFVPADNLRVIGLSGRARGMGLGVPLIAVLKEGASSDKSFVYVPPRTSIAATALLRLEGGLAGLEGNETATLELYSSADVSATMLGERSVPLETDLTVPLAYQLGTSQAWAFEIGAFVHGEAWEDITGIWMLQPPQPGKIPVVFVHGTASSPARWAEMFNQLNADPELRSAYQFWFFGYTTGDPILTSAALLRNRLAEVVQHLDPQGVDPSLRDMVLIGHSQGGLLAKLQVVHTGEVFWGNLERSSFPIEKLSAEDLQRLRRVAVFEPDPAVKRVIFIATPQHGSFVAGSWIGRFSATLASMPSRFTRSLSSVEASPDLMKKLRDQVPTSVDNMKPDHPFVKAIASLDVAEGIHSHSIIAVDGEGPPEDLDDGFVAYKSAHLEHADSELVVRSGHSCQDNPITIREVRRILLEHLRDFEKSHP